MKKVIIFFAKLIKALLTVVALAFLVGGFLYLLDMYIMPAYSQWYTGEFWLSEYSSIGIKELYVMSIALIMALGSLIYITKSKNA